jgi:transcription elongation GreA/GreB family factor
MLMTTKGIEGLKRKIAQLDAERDRALAQAGESAQNDPNQYHDNFEYEEGMRQHGMLTQRVAELLAILREATPAETPTSAETIQLGHVATIRFADDGEIAEFLICGDGEAPLFENVCSVASGLGQALVGMRVGEKKAYGVQRSEIEIEVLGIRIAEDKDLCLQSLPFERGDA